MIKPQMMNELLIQMTAEAGKPDGQVSQAEVGKLQRLLTNVARAAESTRQYVKSTRSNLENVEDALQSLEELHRSICNRLK